MNTLERTLIEKAGADNGWECVLENRQDTVRLASARHTVCVDIIDLADLPDRYELRFSEPVERTELERASMFRKSCAQVMQNRGPVAKAMPTGSMYTTDFSCLPISTRSSIQDS